MKKNRNNGGSITVIVAVLVLIAAVVFFVLQNKHSNKQTASSSSASLTSSSQVAGSSVSSQQSSSQTNSTSEKDSSSSEAVASLDPSQAATTATTSSSALSWAALSDVQKDGIFAAWIQNSQGKFQVYKASPTECYFVNVGSNGAQDFNNPTQISKNSVRILTNSDGSYTFQTANPTQTGLQMRNHLTWADIDWQNSESLSGSQLLARFAGDMTKGEAQISETINSSDFPIKD